MTAIEELRAQRAAYQREWMVANPDRARELRRQDYERHSDRYKARAKAWNDKNRALVNERARNRAAARRADRPPKDALGERAPAPVRPVRDAETRFWEKVAISSGEDSCWEWTAGKDRDGYGMFWFEGRTMHAHRYRLQVDRAEPLPEDLFACHRCDNPPCVRPQHLFAASESENRRDRDMKGRRKNPKGTAHGSSKLTLEEVALMKEMRGTGLSYRKIAKAFGVTDMTSRAACLGIRYKVAS